VSDRHFAAAVNVNPQTIGFLDRGTYTPSVELALKLAAVFRVPVEALFSLQPFPTLASQLTHPTNTGPISSNGWSEESPQVKGRD
jgi:DNA-binding XRE family transcriptional regulator